MKKFPAFISAFFGLAISFAVAMQSADAIGHLRVQFSEKVCHHHYSTGKNEVNHSHHNFEKCFACEFTFSHFVSSEFFTFQPKFLKIHCGYTALRSREIAQFFRGSLFAHRGPPTDMA